jgi:hypothetical protein
MLCCSNGSQATPQKTKGASQLTGVGVAIYFQRDSSTFSRHIGKIDAKAKNSDKLRDRLNDYINTLIQARPYIAHNRLIVERLKLISQARATTLMTSFTTDEPDPSTPNK